MLTAALVGLAAFFLAWAGLALLLLVAFGAAWVVATDRIGPRW